MQINVNVQVVIGLLLNNCELSCMYCWLQLWVRVQIESIQIMIVSVESEISSIDSIWVKMRYYLKLVVVS